MGAILAPPEVAYADPRLVWVVPLGNAVSVVAFAMFLGPLTLLAWADPWWARG